MRLCVCEMVYGAAVLLTLFNASILLLIEWFYIFDLTICMNFIEYSLMEYCMLFGNSE